MWLPSYSKVIKFRQTLIRHKDGAQTSSWEKAHILNRPLFHVAAIIFLVLLVYSNTFKVPFQFDDYLNIVDNPAIKDLNYFYDISSVERIDNSRELSKPLFRSNLFKSRFIGYLTFALNYEFHGLDVRGYHVINVIIHVANSLFIYWLILLTFRTPAFAVHAANVTSVSNGSRNFIAVFTALFFAVHPLQTQAVTYIVQRFASLAAFFYLLALISYIQFRLSSNTSSTHEGFGVRRFARNSSLYIASLAAAILAMETKELAFTLPAVLILCEIMFFTGNRKRRLLYLAPFLLAVILVPLFLSGAVTLDKGSVHVASMSGAESSGVSRESYLFTQFRVIVTYLRLLLFPINQNFDYDYPIFTSFFTPEVFVSFLFLVSMLILALYLYQLSRCAAGDVAYRLRLISFGIFWFFITLSPESGMIPIADVIFEHRVYFPSVGFFLAITTGIEIVSGRWISRSGFAARSVVSLMTLAVLVLSVAAYSRNAVWKDVVTSLEDTARKSPNKARRHYHLGDAYYEQGRLDEAIREYKTALVLEPPLIYAVAMYNSLGAIYLKQGRMEEAVRAFESSLAVKRMLSPPAMPKK